MEKKRIRVVCAIIIENGRVFCAERDYGEFKGLWEFPGGKIEPRETPEQAIVREIKEELDTDIAVDSFFMNEVYEYPSFVLDMDCFRCHVIKGRLETETGVHASCTWLTLNEESTLKWCPADKEIFLSLIATK